MIDRVASLTLNASSTGPLAGARPLVVAMACAWVVCAMTAWTIDGSRGAWSATLAAIVCLWGGLGGSMLFRSLHRGNDLFSGMGAAMLVRMAITLAFLLVVYSQDGPLVDAGLAFYVLVCYMVSLAVDTRLAVSQIHRQPLSPGGS